MMFLLAYFMKIKILCPSWEGVYAHFLLMFALIHTGTVQTMSNHWRLALDFATGAGVRTGRPRYMGAIQRNLQARMPDPLADLSTQATRSS